MSITLWMEAKILNHIFGHTYYTAQDMYVGLLWGYPSTGGSGSDCNEIDNYPNYVRQLNSPAAWWESWVEGRVWNLYAISYAQALEDWGNVSYFGLFDSGVYGGGHLLLYGQVTPNRDVVEGSVPRFDPGDLELTLD